MMDYRRLAAEYGTPLYIYDAASIRARYAKLAGFDVVRYAQKACSTLAILKLLKDLGARVDAVSADEIRRALAVGYTTDKGADGTYPLVYTADIFDRDALELCISKGVHVNCGSIDMIDQLGSRVPGTEITLRINPGFGHGHSRKTNTGGDLAKHGIWYEQIHQAMAHAMRCGLRICGLHMHIGSGTDLEHLRQVAEAMLEAARLVGPSVETISCGGGLPIPYRDGEEPIDLAEYLRLWRQVQDVLGVEFRHPVHLEIEPGRFLVADSGTLLTEIRAIKTQGGNLFYLCDAGFNNLARPIMYGSYHPITYLPADPTAEHSAGPSVEVVVGGPLCESGDIFTQEEGGFVVKRYLPRGKVGDYLLIGKCGAYGSVMGSNYNSKPLAAEILLDGEDARLIRKRQTFDQLIQNEPVRPSR